MKKLISMLLTVMLVLSLTPSAFATTFRPDKSVDELTREELLDCLFSFENTADKAADGRRLVAAEELSIERLKQVYTNYLRDFNTYLAQNSNWTLEPAPISAKQVGPASKFTDVPQDAWYLNELHYAVGNGYISGTGATTFSPDSPITRGQFVTILGRMLGVDATNGVTQFSDVSENAYYAPFVGWAASKGIVNGTSSTTFSPESSITVEQMAVILSNYISKEGVTLKEATPAVTYKDAATISGWATAGMETARKYGLITPDADGYVYPRRSAKRSDAAVALVRLAKGLGLGVEPTFTYEYVDCPTCEYGMEAVAERKAQRVHDELWASGAITSSMTELEKAKVYYKWMSVFVRYIDNDLSVHSHSAYGSLVDGAAVCDGIAKGYAMLLETEGIEVKCIGNSKHMYNNAYLDGQWYYMDAVGGVTMSKGPSGFNEKWYEGQVAEQQFKLLEDGEVKPGVKG